MNSFSIAPYEHQPIIDTYKHWLVQDLYQNFYFDNLNDPNFLKKLSIVQAEGIRHDIALHAAVTHNSMGEASKFLAKKMQSVASLVTTSLDEGFSRMNQRMFELNDTLHIVNNNIIEGNRLQAKNIQEIQELNRNMVIALSAINTNITQATNILKYQIQQATAVLQAILDELKIPESQRERRYHIEEGIKFFNMGMKTGDCLYFEDALDEFDTAVSIEKKDYYSWFYIGMIHLYSKNHIDIDKAQSSFERYFHYAAALPQKHELYDDALIMKAECYYLEQNLNDAYKTIDSIINDNIRASLRGIKYLSASGIADKQIMAVSILKNLVEKNPYIFMQVLEDADILCNEYIITYIRDYTKKVKNEISELFRNYEMEMSTLRKYPISYYTETYNKFESLKKEVDGTSSFGVVDALLLKEKLLASGIIEEIKKALEQTKLNYNNDEARRRNLEQREAELKKLRQERARLVNQGYIDLGLPSGKVWKAENERGSYNYDNAIKIYGTKIPNRQDWIELRDKCRWVWQNSLFNKGYNVIGPNGRSIFFPTNFRYNSGEKGGRYLVYGISSYEDDEGYEYEAPSAVQYDERSMYFIRSFRTWDMALRLAF